MRLSRLYRFFVLLTAVVGFCSCNLFQREQKEGAVVQLGNHYLYQSTLDQVTASATNAEDSAAYAERYIRRWATDIIQYQAGKDHSTPEIEALVEDYRRSLYVAEYERHLVDKRMPKVVSDAEADTFYVHHADRFVLRENILEGILLVLPADAPTLSELKKRMAEPGDEENLEYIEKYAYRHAAGYELFINQWRTSNQILMRMPSNKWQKSLAPNKLFEERDSASIYLLQVTDCRLAGEQMPIEYARPTIDKMILAERRVTFLQAQRNELYEDAVRYGKIRFEKQ